MAQRILYAAYGNELHKCHLKEKEPKTVKIGDLQEEHIHFHGLAEPLLIQWDGRACRLGGEVLEAGKPLEIRTKNGAVRLYLGVEKAGNLYEISAKQAVTFGTGGGDDVRLLHIDADFVLLRDGTSFRLQLNKGQMFHNFALANDGAAIEPGDQLFIEGMILNIGEHELEMLAPPDTFHTALAPLYRSENRLPDEYPDYHRSPRIIYREPAEKRKIAKPPVKPAKPSEQLARVIVPPLVMIAAFVVVSIFQRNGFYLIIMLSMTVVTVIFAITSYLKNLRQYRANIKERDESYRAYFKKKSHELHRAAEEQRHALFYHYPDIGKIRDMALRVDPRIYEKTMFHHDFLMFRVGTGDVKSSFPIEFNLEEFTQEKDELVEEARKIWSQYLTLENVPVTATLAECPVGYIGQRHLVLEQLQLLAAQIALFHSYHDVQFVVIFPEEEKEKWDWMRWLPHASLREMNVRGFVYHERSRDQVLNSLYQILKDRKLSIEEKGNKNEKIYFSPHFVIFITDEKLILDHTIMEYLNEDPTEIGVSLVFVEDVLQSLPEHVKTVIDIRDAQYGNIMIENGELVNKRFKPDHFPAGFHKEDISRALAPLNHLQNLKNAIPESVTFLEMYGVEKVEDLAIEARWARNETYKSLAVPLGLRGKEDIVQLNLHEKAHGPHGLIAGTTGSGKSEIIQSYILSLAVNFHPYEVAFLLIDYKGGGMANLFRKLPHLAGTITNLDGAQSMRALASIKAELEKRQRLFGEYNVNHINQYQKLYKSGEAKEPMPHLFLISDEFAELKSEQPDFMKELVSTARIGRSLGIHLILATQKPSGVVDDQIWSNSKFKLALKVQNTSDSMEILKTPDAAEITLPGRAYLQVGNNEVYELFQSAWSGANYVPDQDDQDMLDTTIYAINDLGQYEPISADLSGLANQKEITKVPTELEAVVDWIHARAKKLGIAQLPKPWLPPLEERIYLLELHGVEFREAWKNEKTDLKPVIGFADLPAMQEQRVLQLNMAKDGHILIYSSPGYGKSTFLQTTVMDLARVNNPGNLHIYLLDFGTNGLLPLKELPHVADTIMIDETEKISKLIRLTSSEIKKRKRRLSQYGVANLKMYEKASKEHVPDLLFVIDNYDAVREADDSDAFEKMITQIAREGASIGLHLVISASRQNAMRMQVLSNIKIQIPLYLIDRTDVRAIVGKTDIEIEEIPGRGIVKLDNPILFQTALPASGTDTLAIIENIQKEAKEMDRFWSGKRPAPIPVMPEVLEFPQFAANPAAKEYAEKGWIPIGLEFENVTPIAIDTNASGPFLLMSDRLDELSRLRESVTKNLSLVKNKKQIMVIDSGEQSLSRIASQLHAYISEQESISRVKNDLQVEIEKRMETGLRDPNWIIFISDLKDFCRRTNITAEEMNMLLKNGPKTAIHFIIGSEYAYVGQSFEEVPRLVRDHVETGLVSMRLSDQDVFRAC
ncbi:type VII secretion protein EssC [Heyndrickxia coagulans]|uniref:type VII secretion protein EssC n=1 Tax=Heyndrickxia coagulans TaxID=1398 RepID=UPI002E22038B|nr:type VII secretion protein EssC [Heyndrickxia coagulans]MED4940568.1 type VII secretion protein EssC [Heyndrickxia coagulans]